MRAAYIQSVGGASGDMLLGALLDGGVPVDVNRGSHRRPGYRRCGGERENRCAL